MQWLRATAWLAAIGVSLGAALDVGAEPFEEPLAEIRLDGPWRGIDGRVRALLSIELSPGWKTYWRAPGEAGVPPRFDWSASTGVDRVDVSFPTPRIFGSYGMRTYGYETAVAFPLLVTQEADAAQARLIGDVTIGVCKEICVFSSQRVELSLTAAEAEGGVSQVSSERLAASEMMVPSPGANLGLSLQRCQHGERYRARLEGETAQRDWRIALVEDPSSGYVVEAKILEDAQKRLWVSAAWPSRLHNTRPLITLIDAQGSVELNGCPP